MAIDKHGYGGYGVYAAADDADVDSDTPEEYEEYDCRSNAHQRPSLRSS